MLRKVLLLILITFAWLNASLQWVYSIGNDGSQKKLQRINCINFQIENIVTLIPDYGDIAFDNTGTLYGVRNSDVYIIDTTTGNELLAFDLNEFDAVGMTIDKNGRFYFGGGFKNELAISVYDPAFDSITQILSFGPYNLNFVNDVDFYNGSLYTVAQLPIGYPARAALFKVDTSGAGKHDTIVIYEKWPGHALASYSDSCSSKYLISPSDQLLNFFFPDHDSLNQVSITDPPSFQSGGATSRTSYLGSIPPLHIDDVDIRQDPCSGTPDAIININIRAGRPPAVEYSIDGFNYQDSSVFINVPPGIYQAFVRDDWGCSQMSDPFTIPDNPGFGVSFEVRDAYCSMNNGALQVQTLTAQDTLMYALDNMSFSYNGMFTDISPGVHMLYMINEKACVDSIAIVIGEIPPPFLVTTSLPEFCNRTDGTILTNASMGTPPYLYSLDGALWQDSLFQNLSAGTYIIAMMDALGCIARDTVFVDSVPGPVIDTLVTHNASCGMVTGSIEIQASGSGALLYALNNGDYGDTAFYDSLFPGVYTISVSDTAGCLAQETTEIALLDPPVISSVIITNAHCSKKDGSLEVIASAAAGGLEYSINDMGFGQSPVFQNLGSGLYMVSVRDSFACTIDLQVEIGAIDGPVIIDVETTPSYCNMQDGTVSILASSASLPLLYALDGLSYDTNAVFKMLNTGVHTVIVRDAAGCEASRAVTIGHVPATEISSLVGHDATCGDSNGSILVVAGVGEISGYSLDKVEFQGSPMFDHLPAGNYSVYLQSHDLCVDSASTEIKQLEGPVIKDIVITLPSCPDSSARTEVIAEGGTGALHYSLNGGAPDNFGIFNDLLPGGYLMEVIDSSGCIARASFSIDNQSGPSIDNLYIEPSDCGIRNGIVHISSLNAVEFILDGSTTNATGSFDDLTAGEHHLRIRDGQDCLLDTLIVIPTGECTLFMPNVFSPNGDDINDFFGPQTGNEIAIQHFRILDRWGSTIYSCEGGNDCKWDGTVEGSEVPPGVYVYHVLFSSHTGQFETRYGSITVIR